MLERACGGQIPSRCRARLDRSSRHLPASLSRKRIAPSRFELRSPIRARSRLPLVPDRLASTGDPPERRPLNHHELRRLSPAAAFARSFIGAWLDNEQPPSIWGLIHSGPNWLQSVRGGRETLQAIPPVPTITVTGPGRVLVEAGPVVIAELTNGTLVGDRLDIFNASWMATSLSNSGRRRPSHQDVPVQTRLQS